MPSLVAFDFDWSLIDDDSDEYVFSHLAPHLYDRLRLLVQSRVWIDVVGECLDEMQSNGISCADILETVSHVPLRAEMIKALSIAKQANSEIIIISDANSAFIERVLIAYGVRDYFKDIITNQGKIDSNGKLIVKRHSDVPHGCQNKCAANMCKGHEIMNYIQKSAVKYDRVIYVGDSTNDFCPSTKLNKNDLVLARKGRVLEKMLGEKSNQVVAQVHVWEDYADILKEFSGQFAPAA